MAIIVGIDGTDDSFYDGKARDDRYDKNFAGSFVRKIAHGRGPGSLYERGPLMHGGNLDMAIASAELHIQKEINRGNPGPLLLTGYSRGAAGVVALATRLNRFPVPIPVAAMLLFDCVNRHTSIESAVIPTNVFNVLHVVRDPRAASREGFGNSGLKCDRSATNYEPLKLFACTHGGMGGCPWSPDMKKGQKWNDLIDEGVGLPHRSGSIKLPFVSIPTFSGDGLTRVTFADDHRVSATVWEACKPFLLKHGYFEKL